MIILFHSIQYFKKHSKNFVFLVFTFAKHNFGKSNKIKLSAFFYYDYFFLLLINIFHVLIEHRAVWRTEWDSWLFKLFFENCAMRIFFIVWCVKSNLQVEMSLALVFAIRSLAFEKKSIFSINSLNTCVSDYDREVRERDSSVCLTSTTGATILNWCFGKMIWFSCDKIVCVYFTAVALGCAHDSQLGTAEAV